MAKILKHFYLPREQCDWLEIQAEKTGKSQAQIVRELIEKAKS